MPDKEGAEEKTTKDVVTKKQKQFMNKEEYVQEMPDDVKNIMMKGLRKGAGEFSKGGDPKNIIKKGVKSTIKNVIKSKSVQNFLNNEYIPEEGYDVARDMGKVKPSKDKKDATSYPPSDEVKKTQKKNKGPSALERVKADIEKRYGKGAIMDVKKEELDLTQVAEAFGGYVIDENVFTKTGDVFSGLKKQFDRLRQGYGSQKGAKQKQKKIVTSQIPRSERRSKTDPYNPSLAQFDDADDVVKINRKKEIPQDKIGVAPGQKEPPVTKYKIGDTPPESKVEKARKAKLKKDLQTDMMSKAEGPKKQGRKITGSTYRKDLDSTVKAKKKLKAQPLVKGLEKAKTKVGTGFKTFRQTASSLPKAAKTATQNLAKNQALKQVTGKLTTGGLKTASKKAAGLVAKRTIGRAAGKALAKQIPGIGQVISGGEAIARFASGDVVGGALSAAEMIPGLGLVAGTANVARDIGRTRRAVKTIKKIKPLSKGMKLLQKSKAGRTLSKMQRTARANPLATIGGGGIATGVGTNVATGKRGGKLPRVPRPKLDQGVVGRRTAG